MDPFRLAAFSSFINPTPQPGVMLGLCFCSPEEPQVPQTHAEFPGVVNLALPRVTWLVNVGFFSTCCFPVLGFLRIKQSLFKSIGESIPPDYFTFPPFLFFLFSFLFCFVLVFFVYVDFFCPQVTPTLPYG